MSQATDYLLIGHITADITEDGRILGGTPSYAAATAHAFGLNVTVLTSAMPDDPLLDTLRHFAKVIVIPADETTTYRNIYTAKGRRQILRGIAAPLTLDAIKTHNLYAPLVHIAPMAAEVDPRITQHIAESTVLMTPQGWMRRRDALHNVYFQSWLDQEAVQAADFVVFSEEDLAPDAGLRQQYIECTQRLVITDGEHGGLYAESGQIQRYAALEVNPLDVTGAGDVFAASLLASWNRLHDFESAVRVAAHLASLSVMRSGLDGAPTSDEIESAFAAIEKSQK